MFTKEEFLETIWPYVPRLSVISLCLLAITFYFFGLYIVSCYEEVNRIQKLTAYHTFCPDHVIESKVKDILIDFHFLNNNAYFVENKQELWLTAAEAYTRNVRFRNVCYKNGLKHRLEKNFQAMF
jgi:hypothetical protein